jgi:hypothetical protein
MYSLILKSQKEICALSFRGSKRGRVGDGARAMDCRQI